MSYVLTAAGDGDLRGGEGLAQQGLNVEVSKILDFDWSLGFEDLVKMVGQLPESQIMVVLVIEDS